jgi:hypothetical protein
MLLEILPFVYNPDPGPQYALTEGKHTRVPECLEMSRG